MSREEAAAWRARVIERLAPVAVALPPPEGRKVAWDEWVDVDYWTWSRVVDCPASLSAPREPFVDSVSNSARRLGLATLRAWFSGTASDPHAAAALVVAGERSSGDEDEVPFGLRTWIDELDPLARAALVTEAATYALRAARAGAQRGRHVYPPDAARRRWEMPGSRLRLDAKVEVASNRVPTSAGLRLLVLDTTSPTAGRAQGLAAWVGLCHALVCRRLPVDVTVRNLRTGVGERFDVDDALLGVALEQAFVAASAAAAASTETFGSVSLIYRPGRWCNRCTGLDLCPDGQEWVSAHRPVAI